MNFNPKEHWASTTEGRQKLVKALMNNSLGASVGIGAVNPADLPRRYFPGVPWHVFMFCFEFVVCFLLFF